MNTSINQFRDVSEHCTYPFVLTSSMRLWFIIIVLAILLTLEPTGMIRTGIRDTTLSAQRVLLGRLPSIYRIAVPISASTRQSISTSAQAHSTAMTEVQGGAANPLPVLSKAAPADSKKVEELPKLSTQDFRIYNRLAIMMDAYVRLLLFPLDFCFYVARPLTYVLAQPFPPHLESDVQRRQHQHPTRRPLSAWPDTNWPPPVPAAYLSSHH